MMRKRGSRPNNQAGNAIDADNDFRLRGGIVMINRLHRPAATSERWCAMASRCQLKPSPEAALEPEAKSSGRRRKKVA